MYSYSDDEAKPRKRLTPQQAKDKIYRYCAYQERSHQEVKNKLYDMGLWSNEVDELLTELITEGFLNEARFASAFVGGKYRMKQWGRIKIVQALQAKGVSPNCIKSGLKEIDEVDYLETLRTLLQKKASLVDDEDLFVKRDKVARHAIQKGYEPELVWTTLKSILPG